MLQCLTEVAVSDYIIFSMEETIHWHLLSAFCCCHGAHDHDLLCESMSQHEL